MTVRLRGVTLMLAELEIAMDDTLLVRRLERASAIWCAIREHLVEWNRAARDAVRRCLAFSELQHQRADRSAAGARPRFFEAVDRADVPGVLQRGEHLRFALKPREPLLIRGDESGRTFNATSRPKAHIRAR